MVERLEFRLALAAIAKAGPDQDVNLGETIDNCPDGAVNLSAIEQIAFDRQNFGAAPSEIRFRAREFFTIARNECHAPTLPGNVSRQHESESAGSATDKNNFLAQGVSRRAKHASDNPAAD